jgi:hypothetical protein
VTLPGARGCDGRQTKLVCVYDHAHWLVLTQAGVVAGDEIAAFSTALSTLPDLKIPGECPVVVAERYASRVGAARGERSR